MATNPPKGDGHRNGAVRHRSQVFNHRAEQWVKRDKETGRFIAEYLKKPKEKEAEIKKDSKKKK